MVRQRAGDGIGEPRPLADSHAPTRWTSQPLGERVTAPSRGVRDGRRRRWKMRVHLFHRLVLDTVIILEERNLPHPRFPRCDMLVPWRALNGCHLATAQYAKGAERKRRWMAIEDMRESLERAFQSYGILIETVAFFKYLGRVYMEGCGNWPELVGNLKGA